MDYDWGSVQPGRHGHTEPISFPPDISQSNMGDHQDQIQVLGKIEKLILADREMYLDSSKPRGGAGGGNQLTVNYRQIKRGTETD